MRPEVVGASAEVSFPVRPEMAAILDGQLVHPVCSTFWLAYYAEVAARRAIEPFLDGGENAVGAELWIAHNRMAPVGAELRLRARVTEVDGNRIWCTFEVFLGTHCVAHGRQLQVVLPHEVFRQRVQAAYAQLQLPPPAEHPNVRIGQPPM
ncbi:hypothetical protein HRbin21_00570 [bacterium HR21]|nr:hypothetical protein HRbin21_00570 [bacterium HR21]